MVVDIPLGLKQIGCWSGGPKVEKSGYSLASLRWILSGDSLDNILSIDSVLEVYGAS